MASEAEQKKYFDFSVLKRVFSFVKPYRWRFIISIILAIILSFFTPVRPHFIQLTVDKATGKAIHTPWIIQILFPHTQLNDVWQFVVAVTIFVKPENVQAFIDATLENARNTRKEPGNLRFDVLQTEDDPNRFLLYEAYRVKDDFAKHQQTDHYLKWKAAVADWMAQPRQGVKHNSIFFGESEG